MTRLAFLGLALAFAASAADRIEGRVWERAGDRRRPLAKALVMLTPDGGGGAPLMARSSAEGAWRIAAPPRGRYYVSASRPGYYVADSGGTARSSILVDCTGPCGPVDFELALGAAVNGVVEDDQGEPLQNVNVRLVPEGSEAAEPRDEPRRFVRGPDAFRREPGGRDGGRTDDLGQFRIAGLRPGRYRLAADSFGRPGAPKFELAGAAAIDLKAGEQADIRVTLQRQAPAQGFTISGSVSGVDLAGHRRMLFVSQTGGEPGPRFGRRSATVNEDGSFEVRGLEGGRFFFTFWRDGEGRIPTQIPMGSLDVRGNVSGVTLAPAPTVALSGRFELDSDGARRGFSVQLEPLDGSPHVSLSGGGADRNFHHRVVAGAYRVRAFAREWFLAGVQVNGKPADPDRLLIASAVDDLVIRLSDRFARVAGRIRAAAPEAAAPRYLVTLAGADEDGRAEVRPTDQNGGFVFDRVAPGERRICARPYDAPREAPCALERRFPVEAGSQIEIDLTLPR